VQAGESRWRASLLQTPMSMIFWGWAARSGDDSYAIRNGLAKRGIEPVIPLRSNRTTPIKYDREAYKRRNLIERCVTQLKQFRRIATRYEKTARATIQCYPLPPQVSG
jgi:transposase